MWIVLAAVAVIAVAAGIILVFRRPEGNDIDSVRSYHSALGTIEHLSERTPRSTVNVVGSGDRAAAEPGVPRSYRRSVGDASTPGPGSGRGSGSGRGFGRSVPPVPVRGNDEFPDPETPLIFDDSRPRDRYRKDVSGESVPVSRMDRAQRHALDSMNHRPKRATTVMIVVAALVLFGALAYAGSKRSSPGRTHTAATSTRSTRNSHPASTRSTGDRSAPVGHTTTTSAGRTPPTTLPKQVVALTSTSTSATYPVADATYKVTVAASGTCWVAVTSSSSGSTLWAGELQAGSVQMVQATGTVTVQMGTPSVTLAIDKVPVVLPTPVRTPFVATFQPTAAASTGSSTTEGTSTTTVPTTTGPTSAP
jgi:flagellar basal body-associated protein FliL